MKRRSLIMTIIFTFCLMTANIYSYPDADTSFAKEITTVRQAKKLAKKQVHGAVVTEVEKDDEDGSSVYEIKLTKGKKEYNLVYRTADSKLISYEWEISSRYIKKGKGKSIRTSQCKKLAKKQVPHGTVSHITKKHSDGIPLYKVKMQKGNRKYELKFHARTGKLLEYEWKLSAKKTDSKKHTTISGQSADPEETMSDHEETPVNNDKSVLSLEAAKAIAVSDAGVTFPEITFTKSKLDYEDGILVYEIEFLTSSYEYEYEIDAATGVIRSKDMELRKSTPTIPSAASPTKKPTQTPSPNPSGTIQTGIGEEQAKQIALGHTGGGTLVKVKLDTEDGILVYEVEILYNEYEYEIEIHAGTGEILDVDIDSIYD